MTSDTFGFVASSFIGRRGEMREIKNVLSGCRLVTLTGPGGVGKSRLASQTVAGLRRAYRGAVARVDMLETHDATLLTRELQDPDLLAHLVASALELRPAGAGTATEALIASLASQPALLLLDNCEHLLPACAVLADALLRNCPGLRIVATSREPLRLAGEVIYPVRPLPTPDPAGRPGVAELSLNESVALFVDRAQAVSRFELTSQDAAPVAELCRRLDGLPLAIELAAERVRALAPGQILERMDQRFGLLSRGPRNAPPRQRTLRACVDWSFELCSKPERSLWARLSVFHDTFELDAVEGICADEALPAEDLLDEMAGLVDKSVVISRSVGDGIHYRMLETFGEYGRGKLIEAGEHDEIRRRHRDWYGHLVRRAADDRFGPGQKDWLDRLDRESPNLRAALTYSLAEPDAVDRAVEIAGGLWHLWAARGRYDEGRTWLDRVLARRTAPTSSRLDALYGNTVLAAAQGDLATTAATVRQAHEVAHQRGDDRARGIAACADGVLATARGEPAEAVRGWRLAVALLSGEQPDGAVGPHRAWQADALRGLGRALAMLGDAEAAAGCHEQIVALCPPGELRFSGHSLTSVGLALSISGDREAAAARLRAGLRHLHQVGDLPGIACCLRTLARTARRAERAGTLLGAAGKLTRATAPGLPAAHDDDIEGDHAAFARGERLTVDEAVAYALDEPRPRPPRTHEEPTPLTRREQQVADLVAQGRSNKDIAAALVISCRTAESHVDHILTKLGLTNRAQIAAWAATGPGVGAGGPSGGGTAVIAGSGRPSGR